MINFFRKLFGLDTICLGIEKNNQNLLSLQEKVEMITEKKISLSPQNLQLKDEVGEVILSFDVKSDFNLSDFKMKGAKRIDAPLIASAMSAGAFQNISKGLFYATADPKRLMTMGPGVGSAVMGVNGGIVGQAPFISAGLAAFAPILIFQLSLMYSMNAKFENIEKKLDDIKKGINLLLAYHEKEMEGVVTYANQKIQSLSEQIYYTYEDFIVLEDLKFKLFTMANKFKSLTKSSLCSFLQIDRIIEEDELPTSQTTGEKIKNFANIAIERTGELALGMFKRTALYDNFQFIDNLIIERFRNSKKNAKSHPLSISNAKLKMNLRVIDPDINRISKTNILVNNMLNEKFDVDDTENISFFIKLRDQLLNQLNECEKKSDWNGSSINQMKNRLEFNMKETEKLQRQIFDDIIPFQAAMRHNEEVEIAIEYCDGKENVYILPH